MTKVVWVVTVFESGDGSTSPWGVFSTEEKALEYKNSIENNKGLNSDGYYTEVTVTSHEIE